MGKGAATPAQNGIRDTVFRKCSKFNIEICALLGRFGPAEDDTFIVQVVSANFMHGNGPEDKRGL